MSTSRTLRAGLGALAVLAACGGGGDDGDEAPPATTAPASTAATLPEDAEPGRGFLLLDGQLAVVTVSSCAFDAVTDPATGVTTELAATAEDPTGRLVDVVRSSFTADVPTVTDRVTITEGEVVLEASRADRDGLLIDLREPNPVGRLIDADPAAGTIRAEGRFGPVGGTGTDPGTVDGELLLRCP